MTNETTQAANASRIAICDKCGEAKTLSNLPPLPCDGGPVADGVYYAPETCEIVRIHSGRPEPAF